MSVKPGSTRAGRGAARVAGDGFRVAELSYSGDACQPRHAHEHTTVTIVLAGSLRESVGRTEEVARALSVVVKPAGTVHADRFGPDGTETLQIRLDRHAWVDEPGQRIGAWRWLHGGDAVAPFLRLLALMREPSGPAHGTAEDAVYDVLAALARGERVRTSNEPPRWLQLVREELESMYLAGPRVRDLARRAGVHPVYLARCFRRHFGCTILEYVRRRRLQTAAQLIRRSDAALATVSLESGFADQSHLCRVFKSGTGLTPLGYRRLAR